MWVTIWYLNMNYLPVQSFARHSFRCIRKRLETRELKLILRMTIRYFSYKNLFYKNIEAEICEILGINPRLRF